MKPQLSNADHLQVLACIEDLHRCRSLADFPEHALRAFGKLLASNFAAFNEVNIPRNRIIAILDRPLADYEKFAAVWEKYSAQHPLENCVRETGDGQAMKISDFISANGYHRLDLYREFYGHVSAEDQMAITIRSDSGFLIALSFNRPRRDFTETDRVKLNLVRPHLLQAYANVEELAGQREEIDDLETALRETGHGMIALDASGQMNHAKPGAREFLARYFPGAKASRSLPDGLADWLREGRAEPFTARAAASRLIVRSPRNAERTLLLLSEVNDRALPGEARLTSRETEVLRWLAEGKSNPEIAVILGVAAGTIKLHVEHILAKLGVDNRTAATVCARESGLLSPLA